MTLISMPKERVDNYRKAIASQIANVLDPQTRRGLELATEDPGRAMLQLLTPYLKGDLLMLHTKYG